MQFSEINEGLEKAYTYKIDESVYQQFLAAFHDTNLLHTNKEYAQKNGFKDKVMHGAILNGLLSHFIGMYFPGERSMLLSSEISYLNPSFLNDEIEIRAVVKQKLDIQNVLSLHVYFSNKTQDFAAAKGKVLVKII